MTKLRFTLITVAAFFAWPVGEERLKALYPLELYSYEGILLKSFRTPVGSYGSALPLDKYPADLVRAVLIAEDARFTEHHGIDFIAVLRAALDNLLQARIRSGASTIPQQLARTIYADLMPQNRYARKFAETLVAVKLSLTYSKTTLLEAYLNQVAMPKNSSGLAAAATRIFGRHITLLSDEQQVALAVVISQGHLGRANFEAKFMRLWHRVHPKRAPDIKSLLASMPSGHETTERYLASEHFIHWLRQNGLPAHGRIDTPISAGLNQSIQSIVANELRGIREAGAEHAAVVVIEKTQDHDALRSMVGSADFTADSAGELNHAVRIRSAGSTLKPFVYGIGFDRGLFSASTMFSDRDVSLGTGREGETYRPHNNDMRYWGDLTLRESLVASRNVPAIIAAEKIGLSHILTFLKRAGFSHLSTDAEHYGPGLALGSGGATLLMLARAYAALASDGEMRPLIIGKSTAGKTLQMGESQRLLSPLTSQRITDMLADRALRQRAFGRRNFLDFPFTVAAKTGTSKDYRDGWVIGYTPRFVVAVWVGNSAGEPMRHVSGAWGAGRIFHQVMRLVHSGERYQFRIDNNLRAVRICRHSGRLAAARCPSHRELIALKEKTPGVCQLAHTAHERDADFSFPEILSPAAGERYVLHPHETAARQEIPIIIRAAAHSTYTYALGHEPGKSVAGGVREFRRLKRGDYTLRLMDQGQVTDEIEFSVR